ncbi:adenosylmethionine decarboxylase [Ottowia sp. GY511]|uniref:Polyamine aminopropyltransferase n=1 Tax=Ottowia flava TaxID=2675430 RepID=A0ABW4L014_9BURK|nr:adenosylmethionine decarboxylase [Ottowia sp. GY511]TXK23411.1 adenosylmethionine decarboxylase [Ottowia sp. GY511]
MSGTAHLDLVEGQHWLLDFAECQCPSELLFDSEHLKALCESACDNAGMTRLGSVFHQFDGGGVTGIIALSESHVSVHTWPTERFAAVDVYVCNHDRDNTDRGARLVQVLTASFRPRASDRKQVSRQNRVGNPAQFQDRSWWRESLAEDFQYGVLGSLIEWQQTPYQLVEIIQTESFGKVLRIDGAMQCSERDEHLYHEPLVHMAMASVPCPRRVLLIGGGDGGAAEEVLKWPSVEALDHVEIDAGVIELSRRHLPNVHGGVLNGQDPRWRLYIDDAVNWLRQRPKESPLYDVVILDLTDSGGPSATLYTQQFYDLCSSVMAPHAALSLHLAAPWAQLSTCVQYLRTLNKVFAQVVPFQVNIPMSVGPWLMAVVRNATDAEDGVADPQLDARLENLQGAKLISISAASLRASRVLPRFVMEAAHRLR